MQTVHTFSKGPLLKVQVELTEGLFHKTLLSPSSSFACEFLGTISNKSKKEILSWLESYGMGQEPALELPLIREGLSPFQRKVLEKMKKAMTKKNRL